MKFLILMSAWSAGESEQELKWLSFYRDVLDGQFPADDKIIAINCGSSPKVAEVLAGVQNSRLITAPESLMINSDASGYQACLCDCADHVWKYDAVLFVHTKAVSYNFDGLIGLREALLRTTLNREVLSREFEIRGSRLLVAERGHLPQTAPSCEEVLRACDAFGQPRQGFTFAATYSIYAASAAVVSDLLQSGHDVLTTNLSALGFNRFFFEGCFPSLLSHLTNELHFLIGAEFNDEWSRSVSSDHLPKHNSAMVLREYDRFKKEGQAYIPKVFPYVFNVPENSPIKVSFNVL